MNGPVTEPVAQRLQPPVPLDTPIDETVPNRARPVGPDALGALLDRHAAGLSLYAQQWSIAGDDIVQETFVELARQPYPPTHVAAWLYRVVRNRAIAAARSEARRRRHEQIAGERIRPWFVADPAIKLDADAAAQALSRLPLEEREVIVMHLWGGLTFAELGEVTGLPCSTAHRRYESGLKKLREQLCD